MKSAKRKDNTKTNNRRKRMADTTINNTLRVVVSGTKQIYGFGRNVMIVNKDYNFIGGSFNRVPLASLFYQEEFQQRKTLFKFIKVNNIVAVIYPKSTTSDSKNIIMMSWKDAGLVEGNILYDDTARNFYLNNTKPIHFSWKPPNSIIDISTAIPMNKPFDINKAINFPGWIYFITDEYIRVTVAINVTLISNDISYNPTEKEKEIKLILNSDPNKFFTFPRLSSDKKEGTKLVKSE